MISFHTAHLKAHYPIEFLVANLMSEVRSNAKQSKDNINKIKAEIRARGVSVVPPDINVSEISYKIVDDHTLMAGLDSLKYMGSDAMPELLAKRPFTSFQDLIYRTDSSKVRANTIQALAASGSLDSFGLDRKLMFHYASDYRAKLRSHMAKLERAWLKELKKQGWQEGAAGDFGEFWTDPDGNRTGEPPEPPEDRVQAHLAEFKYPFPLDKTWTISERFAMEEFYMGEGISGDMFDRYPKFFSNKTIPFTALPQIYKYEFFSDDARDDRKANTHYISGSDEKIPFLSGVISSAFVFRVKKEDSKIFGQEMARFNIRDPWGREMALLCFPEAWEAFKLRVEKLSGKKGSIEPGVAIRFTCLFQWESENVNSLILSDILDYRSPPSLPDDRASKKVKMPRGKKATELEEGTPILELDKEELVTILEDEVLEIGMAPIEDDDDDDDYHF
jgi:DNA polymerase III alpha subunit